MGKQALTRREREVLHLVCDLRCREIAATLAISELTVRKHRANICTKLELGSTAALIAHSSLQRDPAPLLQRRGCAVQALTRREGEVVRALAGGQTSKHIARQLGISPRTVEKHRENCMRKLGARNIAELLLHFFCASEDYVIGSIEARHR